jgi:hypothetical protein
LGYPLFNHHVPIGKKRGNSVSVSFIRPELYKKLRELAKKEGRPIGKQACWLLEIVLSAYVSDDYRVALDDYLRKYIEQNKL